MKKGRKLNLSSSFDFLAANQLVHSIKHKIFQRVHAATTTRESRGAGRGREGRHWGQLGRQMIIC